MICCNRIRELSGSLFIISSRLQRFIDWPAAHISTGRYETTMEIEARKDAFCICL